MLAIDASDDLLATPARPPEARTEWNHYRTRRAPGVDLWRELPWSGAALAECGIGLGDQEDGASASCV